MQQTMSRILRVTLYAALVAIPILLIVGYLWDGSQGLWGSVMGFAVPVVFFSITVLVAVLTAKMSTTALGVVTLGSWIFKIILLIVFLALIRSATFYNKVAFLIALIVGTAGYLVLEAMVVQRSKQPYVEPQPAPTTPPERGGADVRDEISQREDEATQ